MAFKIILQVEVVDYTAKTRFSKASSNLISPLNNRDVTNRKQQVVLKWISERIMMELHHNKLK